MRKTLRWAGCLGIIGVAFFSTTVGARIRDTWPASKLNEKAEIVVIARLVSTIDAKNSDKPPVTFENLVGVDSTFRVLAVVKGKLQKPELVLFHFRYPRIEEGKGEKQARSSERPGTSLSVSFEQTPDLDGPCLVRFDRDPKKGVRYLMFLKKRSDGRYECVSGQLDPDLSVQRLIGPSDGD